MKKLIVLLLTFALVGAAFAQTPTLSASSTLSWGWDLDTGYTGFANTNKATISVLFPVDNVAKKGEAGWWGEIAVKNLYFKISDNQLTYDDGLTFTDWNDLDGDGVRDSGEYATLSAKITNGMWALSVSSKQSFDFADADALYTGDVAVTIDADKAGTSLSYTANGLSVGVTAASKADWTANTANEYALGANASYKVGDAITVSGGVAYDAFDATKQLGGTASVAYSAAPLTVSVATDLFYDPTPKTFDADALLTVGYAVMEGLDAEADAYYSTGDDDVEVKVAVDYAVDPIEAGVSFGIADPITAIAYDLGIYAGYTYAIDAATKFYVYAEYTSDFTGKGSLVPKVSLTNTSVTNTTLKLEYNPDDADVLAGNYGKIIASAKISL
ncbi:MAG: hypothetical protein ABFC21_07665 [Rectinema sp.]|jgi:hypothetical protein